MKTESTSTNQYMIDNFGRITSSKLKCFLTFGPEVFKLKYIDELPEDVVKEEGYFKVGTAFDDLVSYGEEWFHDKYAIKEKLLKAELQEKLEEKGIEFAKGTKVDELEKLYYGDRILLNTSQGESIMGMYREAKRQPLIDMGSDYDSQVVITSTYKGLKLKGTLDRLSLEKKCIRDWKTSGQIGYFEYNLETTFGYLTSMSFYYILVLIGKGVKCDAILDVLGTTYPYPYYGYKLTPQQMFDVIENKIKPGLDALNKCFETDTWESVYPISYDTEGKHGDIIHHEAGEPINRTKLMQSGYYSQLGGGIQKGFIEPSF